MNRLTFIATAHNEPFHNRMFINSMLNQSNQNFNADIIHNGSNDEMENAISGIAPNIMYQESKIDTGSWGTHNRQWCINTTNSDYIIQTSVQDYWLPQAVYFILKGLESEPDILVWNSINHLVSPCRVLNTELAWSKLDWGNFAIRTDIARQVPLIHDQYCGDWLWVQEILKRGLIKTAKKLDLILTIHN